MTGGPGATHRKASLARVWLVPPRPSYVSLGEGLGRRTARWWHSSSQSPIPRRPRKPCVGGRPWIGRPRRSRSQSTRRRNPRCRRRRSCTTCPRCAPDASGTSWTRRLPSHGFEPHRRRPSSRVRLRLLERLSENGRPTPTVHPVAQRLTAGSRRRRCPRPTRRRRWRKWRWRLWARWRGSPTSRSACRDRAATCRSR